MGWIRNRATQPEWGASGICVCIYARLRQGSYRQDVV